MRRGIGLFATLLLAGACYSGAVVVRQRPPEKPMNYSWTLQTSSVFSDASIERSSRQQINARVTLTTVRRDGKLVLRLRVDPQSASVDGRSIEARPAFTLETGADAGLMQADGLIANGASERTTSFFTDFMPPLPSGPVEIGATWPADLAHQEGKSSIDLKGRARLAQLTVRDRRSLARIVAVRQGPVTSTQQVGRTELPLSGKSTVNTDSFVDLDDGTLVSSVARSRAEYAVADPGGDPRATIAVRVVSRLRLLSP